MKTIKTYLPVFSGFYGTLFEEVIDSEIDYILEGDESFTMDNIEFDFKQFREDIAQRCVDIFEDALNRELGTKVAVIFESICSPRQYNFGNDSIDVAMIISEEDFNWILNVIKTNAEEIQEELVERYSSRDGFYSHHSTDLNDWLVDLENAHKFGAMLDILCNVLDIVDEEEMVDRVRGNVSLDYEIL